MGALTPGLDGATKSARVRRSSHDFSFNTKLPAETPGPWPIPSPMQLNLGGVSKSTHRSLGSCIARPDKPGAFVPRSAKSAGRDDWGTTTGAQGPPGWAARSCTARPTCSLGPLANAKYRAHGPASRPEQWHNRAGGQRTKLGPILAKLGGRARSDRAHGPRRARTPAGGAQTFYIPRLRAGNPDIPSAAVLQARPDVTTPKLRYCSMSGGR